MTLTIPQAGPIAGRAAQIRVEATDTGSLLAQAGQVAQQIGSRMEADRLDRQAQKLQLDATRELGQMRLEFEQNTDPDAIDTQWPQRVAELKDRYLKGRDENGMARVDPRIADRFGMAVTELADRHAFALGSRAIDLRRAQREAIWIGQRQEIVTQGATTDQGTLDVLLADGEAAIEARALASGLDAEQVAREKADLRASVYGQRADALIASDPQAFLVQADAGAFNDLGEDLTRYRISAQAAVDQRAAAEVKAAEIAEADRTKAIDKRLAEMTGILDAGRTPVDIAFLDSPEAKARPGWARAKAAQQLQADMPGIRQMTVAELDETIAAEAVRPIGEEWENQRLTVLRQWRDQAEAKWNTGAVEQARAAGMPVADLPEFDPQDPGAFTAGLAKRFALDVYLQDKGFTRSQGLLDATEKAQLLAIVDPKADAAPKVALARSILAASGGRPDRMMAVLGADPVFARSLRLMASTGSDDLATEILRGQQRQTLGTVNLPTAANQRTLLNGVTGGAFDADPGLQAEILASATALYADSAAGINADGTDSVLPFMDDTEAVDRFSQAIQRVTGAMPDADGQLSIGGVQQIGDSFVSLPVGTPKVVVETGLANLERHLRGQRWNPALKMWDSSATDAPPDRLRAFRAAGLDGAAPDLGKTPADLFPNLSLHRVTENSDVYEFRYSVQGRSYTVRRADDAKNRAYRFRLSDLMREAGR